MTTTKVRRTREWSPRLFGPGYRMTWTAGTRCPCRPYCSIHQVDGGYERTGTVWSSAAGTKERWVSPDDAPQECVRVRLDDARDPDSAAREESYWTPARQREALATAERIGWGSRIVRYGSVYHVATCSPVVEAFTAWAAWHAALDAWQREYRRRPETKYRPQPERPAGPPTPSTVAMVMRELIEPILTGHMSAKVLCDLCMPGETVTTP